MSPKLENALQTWAYWYSKRLNRIAKGNPQNEDYTGYEQDLYEALSAELNLEVEKDEYPDSHGVMIKLEGSSTAFRCKGCGANVFTAHATKKLKYRCNGCGETYTGE